VESGAESGTESTLVLAREKKNGKNDTDHLPAVSFFLSFCFLFSMVISCLVAIRDRDDSRRYKACQFDDSRKGTRCDS